jgi:hypothetical protein
MPPPRGLPLGEHREEDSGPVAQRLVFAMDREIALRDADPTLHQIAKWASITPEQEREYLAKAAAIEQDDAAGRLNALDKALALQKIFPGNVDPAIAWAVAVYRADPQPSTG